MTRVDRCRYTFIKRCGYMELDGFGTTLLTIFEFIIHSTLNSSVKWIMDKFFLITLSHNCE